MHVSVREKYCILFFDIIFLGSVVQLKDQILSMT